MFRKDGDDWTKGSVLLSRLPDKNTALSSGRVPNAKQTGDPTRRWDTRETFPLSCLVREVDKQEILREASTDKDTPA